MALAATAIALAPATAAAAPATLKVAIGGTTTGDCITAACGTIQHAVAEAGAGDTIEVGPGTYAENVNVPTEVNLRGANAGVAASGGSRGAETVIDGGAGEALKISAPGVSVDGFTITGAAFGIYAPVATGLHVADDIVESSAGRAFAVTAASADVAIERNRIEGEVYGLSLAHGVYPDLAIVDNSIAVGIPSDYALFNPGENSSFPGMRLSGNSVHGMSNLGGNVENGAVSGNRFDAGAAELALQIDLHESTLSGNTFEGNGTGGCLQLFGSQYGLDPSADATVSGNSFHGCDPYAIQLSPQLERIAITANTITDSYDGINTRLVGAEAPWSVDGEQVSIVGNRIVGISHRGIDNLVEGTLAASDNWWGCNGGPVAGGDGCASVSSGVEAEPWLVLTVDAPDSSHPGESSTVRAAIDTDSSGAHVAVAPDGTPVAYSTDLGSIDSAAATTVAGVADAHLVSSLVGVASVGVTVDNQTVSHTISIEALPSSTPSSPAASTPSPTPTSPQVHVAGGGTPVQVSAAGTVAVASVACPEGSCRIAIQQRQIKIGGQVFTLKLKLDKTLGEGESTRVMAVLSAQARKALAASGKGQAIVKLRLYSAAGMKVIPIRIRLKSPRTRR